MHIASAANLQCDLYFLFLSESNFLHGNVYGLWFHFREGYYAVTLLFLNETAALTE